MLTPCKKWFYLKNPLERTAIIAPFFNSPNYTNFQRFCKGRAWGLLVKDEQSAVGLYLCFEWFGEQISQELKKTGALLFQKV